MKTCCNSCSTGGPCDDVTKSHKDQLPGGLADKKNPDDFDADALAEGIAVELEHTKDQDLATEIAMDHLTEDIEYYSKLNRMEATKSIRWGIRKNYKVVRKIKFQGLDISIEHDKGDLRHWTDDATGEKGSTKMNYPYGYICRTDGADGEQVDVYVGPNAKSEEVFVVHQMKKPNFKRYDEDKVMVGFESAREAKAAYLMSFSNPKFFGSMTSTDITSFKRMFVNKSWDDVWSPRGKMPESPIQPGEDRSMTKGEIESFAAAWRDINKAFPHCENSVQKGLLDQLGKLWGKVKAKFGDKEDAARPLKKWVRGGTDKCKTGVCDRLDGVEIDIDDTFTAMNGMQIDGPQAHGNCKCTLEFRMSKSLTKSGYLPEEQDMVPPAPEGPPMVQQPVMPGMMPMMPPIDPHDMETFEGVQAMLRTIGSAKDPELMQIAGKIWGDGYTFEGLPPEIARAEIIGFLLDQRDLLGVEPAMPVSAPSPSLPVPSQPGSSDFSQPSASSSPSPEAGYSEEVSPSQSLMNWFEADFSQKPNDQEESAPTN